MANAAAKKAKAAQAATANVYQPIILGSNALYVVLLLLFDVSYTLWNILGMITTWALQLYAYMGILDQAANASGREKELVGGAHLDLLGLTVVVQYGTVLHSTKWYYLLIAVPIWGGWWLYTNVYGGGGSKGKPANENPSGSSKNEDPAAADRRQKRAEKRRQKWS